MFKNIMNRNLEKNSEKEELRIFWVRLLQMGLWTVKTIH